MQQMMTRTRTLVALQRSGLAGRAFAPLRCRTLSLEVVGRGEQTNRAREVLVPLIEKKLDGFVLWFFANKEKLEAQERGEACPHHEDPDDCPSKNDASHACPFTKNREAKAALEASWTAEECSEAEARAAAYKTKAERQLQLMEHALGPYARGERNAFSAPIRLTANQRAVEVGTFDALLELYHDEIATRLGDDPEGWNSDREAQQLVQELTAKFLQAAEPDFQVEDK